MPTELKSPGVYIEEMTPFPPSVDQVETAIPAFIGYTERASRHGTSLTRKACEVHSLAEFENWYGKDAPGGYQVWLDPSNAPAAVDINRPYYLYDSLRLYFQNGGERCRVISVGKYKTSGSVNLADLIAGLQILEFEDEPTLIVCPDAVLCKGNGLYDFQKAALAHCDRKGDRMLICDLHPCRDMYDNHELAIQVQEFRTGIGTGFLRYGAAYTPYLLTGFPKKFRFRDIRLKRKDPRTGHIANVDWISLPGNAFLEQQIRDLNSIIHFNNLLTGAAASEIPYLYSLHVPDKKFRLLAQKLKSAKDTQLKFQFLKETYSFVIQMVAALDGIMDLKDTALNTPGTSGLNPILQDWKTETERAGLKDRVLRLFHHSLSYSAGDLQKLLLQAEIQDQATAEHKALHLVQASAEEVNRMEESISQLYEGQTDEVKRMDISQEYILTCGEVVCGLVRQLKNIAGDYENAADSRLEADYWMYKQIRQNIAITASVIPPSGAVAGIYARVDRNRGVWKAPANERIISVIQPAVQITADEQSKYNVDPVTGKSINCIRSFSGAGVVVWGARTLAGNDNEWRYVNVRRFFNMVNESCKKSIARFAFEPNDAGTWIKIQSMIENFLTGLWRQGALQGSKPEHAFYVHLGLGSTMTERDVLEGRLIVEIGMAMIRPAEFMIIRITQQMTIN